MPILDQASPTVLLVSLVAGAVLVFAAFQMFPKKKKYRYVGKVEGLWVYPIKSCKGIKVQEADCTQLGLKWKGLSDRNWAISTASGTMISQRQEPSMALIETSATADGQMQLSAPGMETIIFDAFPDPNESNLRKIKIFSDTHASVDVGDEAGKWMSTYLKREGVRMHYSAPSLEKKDCYNYTETKMKYPAKPGDLSAFPDATSYMILSKKSVDYINEKVDDTVTVMNFRPNILVDVSEAFAEDAWSHVKIGDAALRALDHCTRCVLTTVDPVKAKKNESGEPLAALKKYRSKEGYGTSPVFGMYHTLDKSGTIKVGDSIYAIDG